MLVHNLILNGVVVPSFSLAENSGDGKEYLRLGSLIGNFTLTGDSYMTWGDKTPKNSQIAYQIKVGSALSVPEPTTMLGLALGGAGMAMMRSRRQLGQTPTRRNKQTT